MELQWSWVYVKYWTLCVTIIIIIIIITIVFDPQREKMYLMPRAPSENEDQTAHRVFAWHIWAAKDPGNFEKPNFA